MRCVSGLMDQGWYIINYWRLWFPKMSRFYLSLCRIPSRVDSMQLYPWPPLGYVVSQILGWSWQFWKLHFIDLHSYGRCMKNLSLIYWLYGFWPENLYLPQITSRGDIGKLDCDTQCLAEIIVFMCLHSNIFLFLCTTLQVIMKSPHSKNVTLSWRWSVS